MSLDLDAGSDVTVTLQAARLVFESSAGILVVRDGTLVSVGFTVEGIARVLRCMSSGVTWSRRASAGSAQYLVRGC